MAESASRRQRITQLIENAKEKPFFSLEYFPPKTKQGLSNLYARVARMISELDPLWIQVTWGAGGSTQSTSLDLAGRVQNGLLDESFFLGASSQHASIPELGRNVCLHLTCTNVERTSLDETLDRALQLGITNILALRGDPPRGQEYWVAADERFQHATDLVKYIRERHGDAFCIGVAGYPEAHPDVDPALVGDELGHLVAKQEAGADFIVTQLFYDVDVFLSWYRECRQGGVTIPIIPGVMPIQSYQSFRRMTSLCKAKVPQSVWDALDPARFDDASVREIGVDLAMQSMRRILAETDIRGFHICTLNLEKSVKRILEGLQWVSAGGDQRKDPTLVNVDPSAQIGGLAAPGKKDGQVQALRGQVARLIGEGGVGAATWDEFPNGRYGDARSPAFGQIDGYGVSLKVPPVDALKLWGSPTSLDDISSIFVRYLQGKLECIPWCDCPIFTETEGISKELVKLNEQSQGKGWWTVGSQPSVDGVHSSDETYGFGPAQGYIFQKAFVEFFATLEDLQDLVVRIEAHNKQEATKGGAAWISFFAGNRAGELRSNVSAENNESCAVTWGCFVGKEVVQSTIIEEQSFNAWREEAFAIWSEWELLFPLKSAPRTLLHDVGSNRWLVTVIHHDFKDKDALWRFLQVSAQS